jgi:hypothetical protein
MTPPSIDGYCVDCGSVHTLGEGRAREEAERIMAGFRETRRLDYDRPLSQADPRLRGDRLWEPEGRMFGVLECSDNAERTVFLRAFSSLAGGARWVDGWVPPLGDRSTRAREFLPVEREIKQLTRRLSRLDPGNPNVEEIRDRRRDLSRGLVDALHDRRQVQNAKETRTIREAFAEPARMPGGVGECCAPKLLTHAARLGLRPRGMVEFFWGGATPSENRIPGRFYAPCENRCRPLLGFLLCGIQE